jgi:hypothetical protein
VTWEPVEDPAEIPPGTRVRVYYDAVVVRTHADIMCDDEGKPVPMAVVRRASAVRGTVGWRGDIVYLSALLIDQGNDE